MTQKPFLIQAVGKVLGKVFVHFTWLFLWFIVGFAQEEFLIAVKFRRNILNIATVIWSLVLAFFYGKWILKKPKAEPKSEPESKPKLKLSPRPPLSGPPTRINFGRENISIPKFGNFTLILGDGTQLKLCPYILSYNSPKLRRLIVDAELLDHDVSDIDPAAVRIFVDACYTGTLEKLTECTEFTVFCDLVKMFAVFKVDWPMKECFEFFKRAFQSRFKTFSELMECYRLAIRICIGHSIHGYLEHMVAGIDRSKWGRFLPRALATASTRADMDLILVLTVEANLVKELLPMLIHLASGGKMSDDLIYILENFNFALCDRTKLRELCEDLSEISTDTDCKAVYDFTKILSENGGEGQSKSCSGVAESEKLLEDGTLATLARIHWTEHSGSTWPCTKKRPFSIQSRRLFCG